MRLSSFLVFTGLAAAEAIYNVTDLGTLGGATAQAFGLSSTGQAAGSATTISGYEHAFTSTGSGILDLTVNSGATEGSAWGVNAAGQIVGTQFTIGAAFATLWMNGTAQAIGGAGSYGLAINEAGQTAGMITAANGQGHAFRTVNGAIQDLGVLPGGSWSAAYGINAAGQAAGYGMTSGGMFRAFLWSPSTGYDVLGTLGGANSYAMGLNDAGQLAGSAQVLSGYLHAFRSNGSTLQDLGTLGGSSSYAYGINQAGDVVGNSSINIAGDSHAFLFAGGAMLDLNTLIDPSSGWLLDQAFAINGSGQIVGGGLLNGVAHAFRLDYRSADTEAPRASISAVPEPATWLLVLTALGSAAAFTLRSRLRLRRLQPVPPSERPRSDA